MPRDLTHIIIADDILKRSKDSWAKGVAEQSTAMHMGAIAHDSFLYGPSPKLSTKMHGGFGDDPRAPASWDRHGLRPRGFSILNINRTCEPATAGATIFALVGTSANACMGLLHFVRSFDSLVVFQ